MPSPCILRAFVAHSGTPCVEPVESPDALSNATPDAQYDTPVQAPEANLVVSKLADYLKSVGY